MLSNKGVVTAIMHVFVESNQLEKVGRELTKLPEVVDVYEVTGEFDVVAIVVAKDISDFRNFLKDRVLRIPGVKSVVTSIVLHIYKREGVEAVE
ncbi:MAG: Lrp/AsnC ligand binding domain-containing protein [Nitrososphaerota archaeon]|nr:Lrp/AsnC ligand binding domain-containing protein [Nitrososphaerota archaeon]